MFTLLLSFWPIPLGVAVGLMLLLFYVGGNADTTKARLQAVLIAFAFGLGSFFTLRRLDFPPRDFSEALTFCALVAATFVLLAPKELRRRYAMRGLFTLVIMFLLLWQIQSSLVTHMQLRNLFAFFCLSLGAWSIIERVGREVQLPSLVLLPLVTLVGVIELFVMAKSKGSAQIALVYAGVLLAMLIVALVRPQRLAHEAVAPFVSVFLVSFMVAGHFYLDINPWNLIFVCSPLALLWARPMLPLPRKPLAEMVVLGVMAAVAVGGYLMQLKGQL
jgi:hypothetical protein